MMEKRKEYEIEATRSRHRGTLGSYGRVERCNPSNGEEHVESTGKENGNNILVGSFISS